MDLFLCFTVLPSLILCRRVGFRITQLIGAVLLPTGLVLTSFTTESWQGLLLSGVCAGKSIILQDQNIHGI